MGSFSLSSFGDLPLPEQVAAATHASLLLFFLFFASARRVFACAIRRIPAPKDDVRSPHPVRGDSGCDRFVIVGYWFKITSFCCFFVFFLQAAVLGYETVTFLTRDAESRDYTLLYLPAVQGLAWLVLGSSVFHCKFKALAKFPFLIRLWWFISFIFCLYTGYLDTEGLITNLISLNSHILANYASSPALAFLLVASIRGVTSVELYMAHGDLREPLFAGEEEEGCLRVTPYSEAGLFSLATLSWLDSLLLLGAKRPLELRDVPLLSTKERSKTCYKILNSNWERLKAENPENQPSLALAIFRSFWKEAAFNAIFAGLFTAVSYVGPYLISYFVDYLSGNIAFPHEGYILASIFFAAKLIETLTTRQWYLGVDILGMHVRSALTAMVYRKGLRLSSTSRQSHTSGEIVNYMAVDVQRIGDYSWYLHDIWMLPLQIILALAILYKNVGIASVATLVATIVSIIVTIPLAKIQEEYQDNLMAAKDERMRKTSECLRNMRILKLQAWEDRYRLKLEEMRNVEFKWLKKTLYAQSVITFIFWGSPIFVSVVTFATSILLGGHLTAGGVLSALATFRILQEPLRNFPDLISMIAQTKVSLGRISGFLQEEELQEDATIVVPRGLTNNAIEIKDGEFCWDPSSATPTVSGIQLKVEKGMRIAVCGIEYILMALASKTVVYVTHQVEFLPAADKILVLKDGRIIQAGRYEELLQAGTDFNALVSAHHEAIETMDILEDSSEPNRKRLTSSPSNIDQMKSEALEDELPSERKAIKEKKKVKRMRKKQLAQEEERERGRVSLKVYLSYMAAAYRGTLIPLIVLAQIMFQVLQIAGNWWMAWANPQTRGDKPKTNSVVLLVVYMSLAFGSSLFVFIRSVLVATFGLAAAQKLFLRMLRTVFRAPMSFFDSTPAGRILNRVSNDIWC
ncbi:hypothetical protein B296_00053589 [Ensete ventricosum]|uniref:ABC transmembrane type-1 domain-containing protein n=1 Tax=Ensete ventricosum TaxID=4639 RepID=A0A426Y7H2_ENSVE|nr:hypothetical protein B296_00053589 [Ensete ventricosum]